MTLQIFQPLRTATLSEISLCRINVERLVGQFAYREPSFFGPLNCDGKVRFAL
jgi:hypothetical protein